MVSVRIGPDHDPLIDAARDPPILANFNQDQLITVRVGHAVRPLMDDHIVALATHGGCMVSQSPLCGAAAMPSRQLPPSHPAPTHNGWTLPCAEAMTGNSAPQVGQRAGGGGGRRAVGEGSDSSVAFLSCRAVGSTGACGLGS